MKGCLHLNELTTILNIIKTSPKYISFFHFIYKKIHGAFKKWICYQSLNVQHEVLTDRNTAGNHQRMFGFI